MENFIHNLKTLFQQLDKHYSELKNYPNYSFLEDYCNESGKTHKKKNYHFGYNSLKWIIFSLRSNIHQEEIERLFKNLIFQFFILDKSPHDLQYKISSFPEAYYYKDLLDTDNSSKNYLNKLKETKIGPFPVIINTTGQNLTNKIFTNYNPEIIIAANNTQSSKKALIFKSNGYLATKEQNILSEIYKELIEKESGWTDISQEDSFNLFINNESSLNENDLYNIVESKLNAII